MPSKLHLKRTPAEQAAHDLRKARKAARRAKKHSHSPSSSHRHRKSSKPYYNEAPPDAEDDTDDAYGPPPPPKPKAGPSNYTYEFDFDDPPGPMDMGIDEEEIRARVEEERFREKMFGAFQDDERLDAVEANMNDYAHVPRRWREDAVSTGKRAYAGGASGLDKVLWDSADPATMDEEEYAEWIRAGMWRKKNAATIEAQAAAAARQEALKAEAARQEREAEAIRHRRRRERQHRREQDARGDYERRWLELLLPSNASATATSTPTLLGFSDIPWPILHGKLLGVEDLTSEAISSFLFPVTFDDEDSASRASKKKEKLRETMLKFHPDKFEGRIMKRVREEEKEKVREGVSAVVRATSALMQTSSGG